MSEKSDIFRAASRSLQNLWQEKEKDSFLSFLLRISLVLLIYVPFDRLAMYLSRLPPEIYFEDFIIWSFLKHISSGPSMFLAPAAFLLCIVFRNRLLVGWHDLNGSNPIRMLVIACAFLLTWRYTAYDYNLFLDQPHYLDRFLLITVFALSIWRPIFLSLFLALLLPIVWQLGTFPGFSWATTYLPVRIITLFCVFLFLKIVFDRFSKLDFIFLVSTLVASHYFAPGFAKLTPEWVINDRLYLFLPAAYTNGWLSTFSIETIERATRALSYVNVPLKLFTLVAECGALTLLWNRLTSKIFPAMWVILHIGIFLTSGIFFWMWMFIDLLLIYLFFVKNGFRGLFPISYAKFAVSLLLIAGGIVWYRPVVLAWYEIPVSYGYRFEALTGDGSTFELTPGFFAPYENHFTVGAGFSFLSSEPTLANTGGGTFDLEVFKRFSKAPSIDQLEKIERDLGTVHLNPKKVKELDSFLRRFIENWNQRGSKNILINQLRPPLLIWTFPVGDEIPEGKKITKVHGIQIKAFFGDGKYTKIAENRVYELVIEDDLESP